GWCLCSCPLLRSPHELHVLHPKVVEDGFEETLLGLLEVASGLVAQDAEGGDHVVRCGEIALERADGRILDLAEVQQRLGAQSEDERGKVDRLLRSEVRALRRLRHPLAAGPRGARRGTPPRA